MNETNQTHVEINLKAIQANAIALKKHTGCKLIAVVKADAYGHGVIPTTEALQNIADMFAVATVDEGIELRQAGIQGPILILFSPLPDYAKEIVNHDLTTAVDNWTLAEQINRIVADRIHQSQSVNNLKTKIHINVNTGMNRCGVRYTETIKLITKLNSLPLLEIEGIFTHFATADEEDICFVHQQLNRLSSVLRESPNISLKHVANSAAALTIPESYLDAVRTGLSLYGIYPAKEKPIQLIPALTWKARVGWVDYIEPGESVSYGQTYKTQKRIQIAGIQVGYGDGYPRALSGKGEVLIRGIRRPILGRVCMDVMVCKLDPTDSITVGDEVVLIGKQCNEEITVNEMADRGNTISYEILTNIGKRVKRIYT